MRLFFVFFFISCSHSIIVKTPVSRFLSAESQGESLKGNILIFMAQGNEAQIDLRNSRVDNALVLDRESSIMFDPIVTGEIGVWGPIDLIHISGGRMGADMTGAKVQLYGKGKNTASKNNFSVSILGGYGNVVNNVQEGEDLELVPLNDDTTSELQISNHALGILIGYRTSDKLLVNLGYSSVFHDFSGKLDSQNTALDNQSLNYKGHSALTTLGIFSYSGNAIFGLEFTSEKLKWDKTNETHNVFSNLAVGYSW